MKEKLYDQEYVKGSTDLPLLVRMDTMKLVSATEAIDGYKHPATRRGTRVLNKRGKGAFSPFFAAQGDQVISAMWRP